MRPSPSLAEIAEYRTLLAERCAALTVAIRLMEMHLELATPGGAGRESIAWAVAQSRVAALQGLLDELQAQQAPIDLDEADKPETPA
jgi:hypothetical protein